MEYLSGNVNLTDPEKEGEFKNRIREFQNEPQI